MINSFKNRGSFVDNTATADTDVKHRIKVGWMKWRTVSGVMCDKRVPPKLKGKVYKTVVRPALTYSSQTWARLATHNQQMHVAETRMLRWSMGVTLLDHVRNEHIRGSMGIEPIKDVMDTAQLRWYGHIERRDEHHLVHRTLSVPEPPRRAGRPKATWQNS